MKRDDISLYQKVLAIRLSLYFSLGFILICNINVGFTNYFNINKLRPLSN